MIITDKELFSGHIKGVLIFTSIPILSGAHKGKFATSENALNEFPEIFANEPYIIEDLDPSAFQIDYTPPTPSGLRVAIPTYWEMLFPDDKFILNGFEVQLERVEDNLAVDIAYLQWKAFQEELDKPENAAIKRHMMQVWEYVLNEANNGNFI